jgi:hypothetical protein
MHPLLTLLEKVSHHYACVQKGVPELIRVLVTQFYLKQDTTCHILCHAVIFKECVGKLHMH